MPLRLLLVALAAVCALAVAGCGNKHSIRKVGELESTFLDLDSLKYQVQISRELNPADAEDRYYLTGLARRDREVARDEAWFGVFIQVENDTDDPHPSAREFEIEDTDHIAYHDIRLAPVNVFAYRPTTLEGGGKIPAPDTPAFAGPTQGALLLFKVKQTSLDARPLVLKVKSVVNPDDIVEVDLDV